MINGYRPNPATIDRSSAASIEAQEAFDRAVSLEQDGDLLGAEESYRAADERGHAAAAVRLGVLLEEHDDFDGAEAAFRRADARGDAVGAFHLAWMLQEGGDLSGAEQAYRRAEMRGHPGAHANLRMMLAAHGPSIPYAPGAEPALDPELTRGPEPADDAPVEAETPRDAADALAIALAAMSGQSAVEASPAARYEAEADAFAAEQPTVEIGQPLRAVARGEAVRVRSGTGRRSAPARAGDKRSGSAPRAARSARPERPRKAAAEAAPAGLLRRMLGVVLPVVAFGAAFTAGASTRTQAPIPVGLAPAVNLARQSVAITSVASLPTPAPLPKLHPPAKHPAIHGIVVPLPPNTGTEVSAHTSRKTPSRTPSTASGGSPVAGAATATTPGTGTTPGNGG